MMRRQRVDKPWTEPKTCLHIGRFFGDLRIRKPKVTAPEANIDRTVMATSRREAEAAAAAVIDEKTRAKDGVT
jgi:hypothetical protein